MKGIAFPYRVLLRVDGHPEAVPALTVQIFHSRRSAPLSVICLVDSGASISLLPREDGEILGIDIEKGHPIHVFGLGKEPISAYRHDVYMRFESLILKVPILFAHDNVVPRIIGREGVFSQLLIIFDEAKRRSGFARFTSRDKIFFEEHLWRHLELPSTY